MSSQQALTLPVHSTLTEFMFDEDEVRMLRWLFDAGWEAAGLMGDAGLALAIGALAPRVWNLRAGIDTAFDALELTLLARAVSLGRGANRNVLLGRLAPAADIAALRLIQGKIGIASPGI